MRHIVVLLALLTLVALPMAAQNTDIESLSGLQFNFGNPGARSLGMGGAFLGLADDASAAEANPAGLTILRKPEISVEGRNYLEQQLFTTTGTFPDLTRTAFNHYSRRAELTFASAVYPIGNFTVGAYFHEPLRNAGAGSVLPTHNQITGVTETDVPNFFLPKGGTPVTAAECAQIRQQKNDPFACLEYTVLPFISALDVQEQTIGLAGAWKIGNFSIGGAARYQTFKEGALTVRVTPTLDFSSIAAQITGNLVNGELVQKKDHDVTYTGGFKWAPMEKFSVGGVFKKGAKFKAPTFAATDQNLTFEKVADTTFHIPDIYGAGVSFRPIPVLTLNADAVRVKYSNLVDQFVSVNATVRAIDHAYKANDVTELHAGAEYFFGTKIPFALRAGWWRDPAHSVTFTGPLTTPDAVAAAILYPKGTSQTHKSVGAGLAWPKFQVDAAYDTSEHFKVGSISAVMRF